MTLDLAKRIACCERLISMARSLVASTESCPHGGLYRVKHLGTQRIAVAFLKVKLEALDRERARNL